MRLDTPLRVRRFLASLVKDWHDGRLPSEDLSRVTPALRALATMITGSDVEQRLAQVEQRLEELRLP